VETTPAPPAADDHRFVGERRILAFLDRREEGVAIDMGDGERVALGMDKRTRRAAGGAARA
jgi:hypothetical protein